MMKFIGKNWPWMLLVLLSGLIVWPLLLPGYFSHHDDLQVMRIFEMRKCFDDMQIPCRWVPDMGYGNGYPLFNFYGVFPYYLGAFLSFFLGYVVSAKMLFLIPLVAGGVGMYFLSKELFGKISGLVAGALYLFAPYRALDAFVRGAVAELFAMTAVPFLLYFILKSIKASSRKNVIYASVFLAIFLLSHNIMTLIFLPVVLLLTIFFLFKNKWKNWRKIFWVFILGFGLSAFFILPAFVEKNLVQTEALTRAELDFRAQFVKVSQIFFDKSWNYSGSNPGQEGTISYQIGWPLWWFAAFSIIPVVFFKKKARSLATLLLLVFGLSVFMMHNKSAPVWESIKILSFVQFPWRFLSIGIFAGSLLGSYVIFNLRGKALFILSALSIFLAIGLNMRYFKPEHFYYDVTDIKKLSGQSFIDQQKGALLDYMPKTALEPRELAPAEPIIVEGPANISNFVLRSDEWNFESKSGQESKVNVPVFDFPNWVVYVDGVITRHTRSKPLGRIEVAIPSGEHKVSGELKNTPLRTLSNLISLSSLIGMVGFAVWRKS